MYANRPLHPPVGANRVGRPRTWIRFGMIRQRLGVPRLVNLPNPGNTAISRAAASADIGSGDIRKRATGQGQGLASRQGWVGTGRHQRVSIGLWGSPDRDA